MTYPGLSARLRVAGAKVAVIAAVWLTPSASAAACDEFASRLIAGQIKPAIEALGCRELGRAGLTEAEHQLEAVCYASTGPSSEIAITARLRCRTGDRAVIRAQISEKVTAKVRVRAADCGIEKIDVDASGEIGKILLRAFGVEGRVRTDLQQALARVCQP